MDKVKIAGKVIMTLPASPFYMPTSILTSPISIPTMSSAEGLYLRSSMVCTPLCSFLWQSDGAGGGNVPGFAFAEPKGLAKRAGIC